MRPLRLTFHLIDASENECFANLIANLNSSGVPLEVEQNDMVVTLIIHRGF